MLDTKDIVLNELYLVHLIGLTDIKSADIPFISKGKGIVLTIKQADNRHFIVLYKIKLYHISCVYFVNKV